MPTQTTTSNTATILEETVFHCWKSRTSQMSFFQQMSSLQEASTFSFSQDLCQVFFKYLTASFIPSDTLVQMLKYAIATNLVQPYDFVKCLLDTYQQSEEANVPILINNLALLRIFLDLLSTIVQDLKIVDNQQLTVPTIPRAAKNKKDAIPIRTLTGPKEIDFKKSISSVHHLEPAPAGKVLETLSMTDVFTQQSDASLKRNREQAEIDVIADDSIMDSLLVSITAPHMQEQIAKLLEVISRAVYFLLTILHHLSNQLQVSSATLFALDKQTFELQAISETCEFVVQTLQTWFNHNRVKYQLIVSLRNERLALVPQHQYWNKIQEKITTWLQPMLQKTDKLHASFSKLNHTFVQFLAPLGHYQKDASTLRVGSMLTLLIEDEVCCKTYLTIEKLLKLSVLRSDVVILHERFELVRQYFGMPLDQYCFELLCACIHAIQRSPASQILYRKSLLFVRMPEVLKLWQKVQPGDFVGDAIGLLSASQYLFDKYVCNGMILTIDQTFTICCKH